MNTSIAELLCAKLAVACQRDTASIDASTRLLELDLDSLSLVALIAQIESVHGIELGVDRTVKLLEAECVGDLVHELEHALRDAAT